MTARCTMPSLIMFAMTVQVLRRLFLLPARILSSALLSVLCSPGHSRGSSSVLGGWGLLTRTLVAACLSSTVLFPAARFTPPRLHAETSAVEPHPISTRTAPHQAASSACAPSRYYNSLLQTSRPSWTCGIPESSRLLAALLNHPRSLTHRCHRCHRCRSSDPALASGPFHGHLTCFVCLPGPSLLQSTHDKAAGLPFHSTNLIIHPLFLIIQWHLIPFWIKIKYFLRNIRSLQSNTSASSPNVTQLIFYTPVTELLKCHVHLQF